MRNKKSAAITTRKDPLPDIVLQAFDSYPELARGTLLDVRELIFDVKNKDPDIGELQEALRWGELSFITDKPKTGSMIRLALTKSGEPALFFHCGTSLIETFRAQYSHIFEFEKNRAMILVSPVEDTFSEISHCIKQALRYKLDSSR